MMTTIKSYTDIEQSKKLAEILPLESADMYYPNRTDVRYQGALPIEFKYGNPLLSQEIAAWSLAALRNLLPAAIKINKNTYLFESHNTFNKSWVYRYYNENDASYLYYSNMNEIDACYELILKLNELKML